MITDAIAGGEEGNEGNKGGGGGGDGKPIVIDLDGDGFEIDTLGKSSAKFDFDNDGYREKTAWVGKDDGLLMFDVGNAGKVTEVKEIAFVFFTENDVNGGAILGHVNGGLVAV